MSTEKLQSLKERVIFYRIFKGHPESETQREEMIRYCADSIKREFGRLTPAEVKTGKDFYKNIVENFINTGSTFFVMALNPLVKEQKEQWIGLFQLQPIVDDGKLFSKKGLKPAHLRNVIIEKSFRGLGLGNLLIQTVRKEARKLGFGVTSLDIIKPSLEQFYLKNGARGVDAQQEGRQGKTRAIALDFHHPSNGFPIQRFFIWCDIKPANRVADTEAKTQGEDKEEKTLKRSRRYSI